MRRLSRLVVYTGVLAGGLDGLRAEAQSVIKEPVATPVGNVAEYSLNFRFTAPKGWEIQRDVQGVRMMALAPQRPGASFRENFNVSVGSLPSGYTLDRYVAENKSELQNQLDAFIVKDANFKVGATPGRKVVYRYHAANFLLQGAGYATIVGGRGFVLTGTSTAETFNQWESRFDAMAKSFAVK